ncbi:MAG: OsmC family protein [Bacteroidales bacterium]|nr:OsmC family protein [Lentimicrobiaceae bacterium]MDD5694327.1 OsmC family protein [Bacteroidales bacterium]
MITSKIIYEGNLRTRLVHIRSQQQIFTDAPVDNMGKGEAFSPTDLMATSLGSCMLTIMGIAAQTHHFNIDGTSVEITKLMAANPRRISEIVVELTFPPHHYTEKIKKILMNASKTCPVALSLHPDIRQTVIFHFS